MTVSRYLFLVRPLHGHWDTTINETIQNQVYKFKYCIKLLHIQSKLF